MSYNVRNTDTVIHIEESKLQDCADAIVMDYNDYTEGRGALNNPRKFYTFDEVCEALEWEPNYDGNGNLDYLHLSQFNASFIDDAVYAAALAKFAQEGGWLQFAGEDGNVWRYLFKDGKAVQQLPKWE